MSNHPHMPFHFTTPPPVYLGRSVNRPFKTGPALSGGGFASHSSPPTHPADSNDSSVDPDEANKSFYEMPMLRNSPVTVIKNETKRSPSWSPSKNLPLLHSDHPYHKLCHHNDLISITSAQPMVYITVWNLQNLVNTNTMTNDGTMFLFL